MDRRRAGYAPAMDDEYMFEAAGAIGAVLEERAEGPVLRYYFADESVAPPAAIEGFRVRESPDVAPDMVGDAIADVVELRLSRHASVKRMDDEAGDGVMRMWALSDKEATPGLDAPMI